jgi:hypothetical protein
MMLLTGSAAGADMIAAGKLEVKERRKRCGIRSYDRSGKSDIM